MQTVMFSFEPFILEWKEPFFEKCQKLESVCQWFSSELYQGKTRFIKYHHQFIWFATEDYLLIHYLFTPHIDSFKT